ncbi:MAG: DUF2959 domain-containing protein [Methylococcaceae bacterium]
MSVTKKTHTPPPNLWTQLGQQLYQPVFQYLSAQYQKLYFRLVESTGHHKRDILITRVEHARDSLEEAKGQFQNALEQFSILTRFEGGDLEHIYRQLKSEYDYSKSRALAVHDRIDAVEDVAEALFTEWDSELEQYSNRSLRNTSRQKLKQTRQHYGQLLTAMRRAETRIEPVIAVFQDQVLFLKHNLNAQAIAALENELSAMTINVATLIEAMERSISRANEFVESLNRQKVLPSA